MSYFVFHKQFHQASGQKKDTLDSEISNMEIEDLRTKLTTTAATSRLCTLKGDQTIRVLNKIYTIIIIIHFNWIWREKKSLISFHLHKPPFKIHTQITARKTSYPVIIYEAPVTRPIQSNHGLFYAGRNRERR